jgi:hypothetical protein
MARPLQRSLPPSRVPIASAAPFFQAVGAPPSAGLSRSLANEVASAIPRRRASLAFPRIALNMPRYASIGRKHQERRSGPNERGTFAVVDQDVNILGFEQPDEFIDDRPLLIRRKIDAAQPAFRRKRSDRMASHAQPASTPTPMKRTVLCLRSSLVAGCPPSPSSLGRHRANLVLSSQGPSPWRLDTTVRTRVPAPYCCRNAPTGHPGQRR